MPDESPLYSYTRCAEDISLLELLGQAAAPPTHNPYIETPGQSSGHILSLRTERHLAAELATLSSLKDDCYKVTAVCIQEVDSQLRILVAANAASSCDSGYLRSIKSGFDGLFETLRRAHALNTPRDETVRQVFMAVIAMCRGRILTRARLGVNESKTRFPRFLEEAVEGLSQLRHVQNTVLCKNMLSKLIVQMNEYSERIKTFRDAAALDGDLADIIDQCGKLQKVDNWQNILLQELDRARPRMNPKEREALLNMTEKMSQYRYSAERLVKIFRSQQAIRRASTVLVRLDDAAFERRCARPAHVREVLARIAASNGARLKFGRLAEKLKCSEATANDKFQRTLKNTLENSRVHAEMQLIWYLGSNPSQTPPRVLASNKDACYLCNAFISLHGMYTTPRTHGRVYAGWRLPATELGGVHKTFVRELERMVVSRARDVLSGAKKLECPLESTCNSSMGSLTTMLTADQGPSPDGGRDSSGSDSEATLRPGDDGESSVGLASEGSSHTPTPESNSGAADNDISANDVAGETARADGADPSRDSQIPHGVRISSPTQIDNDGGGSWSFAETNRVVMLRLSERLRVYIEYSTSMGTGSRRLRFRLHQMSAEEAKGIVANGEVVYDVHRELPPLQDVLCKANSRFVNLRAGSDVFRIELG